MTDDARELRVEGARKRDAGRGIARLPGHVQTDLGILSGDPIIIEGEALTVAKVWPGEDGDDVVRIDADTRASAGVTIGDTVTVRRATVEDATRVVLQPADEHADDAASTEALRRRLVDRLVRPGKRLRI
jgi:transitional endoplasmic reticulum ATPase